MNAYVLFFSACEDGCTGVLFEEIDDLSRSISRFNFTNYVPVPWNELISHENITIITEEFLQDYIEVDELSRELVDLPDMLPLAQIILQRVECIVVRLHIVSLLMLRQYICRQIKESQVHVDKLDSQVENLSSAIHKIHLQVTSGYHVLEEVISHLKNYAIGETHVSINVDKAVAEAESHWLYILSVNITTVKNQILRELE